MAGGYVRRFRSRLNAVINRLRDTLGDSADTPRFVETLPRRGYRLIVPVNGNRPVNPSGSTRSLLRVTSIRQTSRRPQQATNRAKRSKGWLGPKKVVRRAGIAALSASVLIGVEAARGGSDAAPAVEARRESCRSRRSKGGKGVRQFRPTGTGVAFTWSGGQGDNPWDGGASDMSVKIHRVCGSPTRDHEPSGRQLNAAWYPDGRHIAFERCEEGGCHVTSPLGGSELKVSDLPIAYPGIAWSP